MSQIKIYDAKLGAWRHATSAEAAADRKARFGCSAQQLAVLATGPDIPMVRSVDHVLHCGGKRALTVGTLNFSGALVFVLCPNGEQRWLLREQYSQLKAAHDRFRAASNKKPTDQQVKSAMRRGV